MNDIDVRVASMLWMKLSVSLKMTRNRSDTVSPALACIDLI